MAERPPQRRAFILILGYWLPVLLYVTVIVSLSAQPHLQPPLNLRHVDKALHLLEYGGLGVLLARALRHSLRVRVPGIAAMMALGIGMAVGAGDEYFQSFIPGRESSVFDFLADSLGIALAQLAYLRWVRE